MNFSNLVRQHWAALRALLVLTVITGIAYPLVIWLVALLPGLHDNAEGSIIEVDGKPVGSSLIGQLFTDADGKPLPQYFQSRPSAAGDGYDPLATSASNLGPESIVDTPGDPSLPEANNGSKASLLTTVCSRSAAVGELEGVNGSRPFCTGDGVGAVLSVIGPRDSHGNVIHPTRVVSVNELCAGASKPFLDTYGGPRSPGRCRHRQRQRFGSTHLGGLRRPAGRPGGQGPRHQRRAGQASGARQPGRAGAGLSGRGTGERARAQHRT
jgi:K+-transporting ATPase ATPase C chain